MKEYCKEYNSNSTYSTYSEAELIIIDNNKIIYDNTILKDISNYNNSQCINGEDLRVKYEKLPSNSIIIGVVENIHTYDNGDVSIITNHYLVKPIMVTDLCKNIENKYKNILSETLDTIGINNIL